MFNCLIGIDGGGTKTNVKVKTINGDVILSKSFGPSNFNDIGKVSFESLIKEILIEFEEIGVCMESSILTYGGAGLDTKTSVDYVTEVFQKLGYKGKLRCVNDSEIALVAGNGAIEGAVIICGTGSIALGKTPNGLARVGGWGHILGDEGSGYYIVIETFKSILRCLDGRCNYDKEALALLKKLGFENSEALLTFVYTTCENKSQIAKYAKILLDSYESCPIVKMVINISLEENLLMVDTLVNKMESDDFQLSLAGGLFENSDLYFSLVKGYVGEVFPKIKVIRPKLTAVDGALLISENGEEF